MSIPNRVIEFHYPASHLSVSPFLLSLHPAIDIDDCPIAVLAAHLHPELPKPLQHVKSRALLTLEEAECTLWT